MGIGGEKSVNINRDIEILLSCKPILMEVSRLREKDAEERHAYIGSQRMDGMPKGSMGSGGMEDTMVRYESLHQMRVNQMTAYEDRVNVCEMILRKVDIGIRPIVRMLYVDQLPIWRVAQISHVSESTVKRIKNSVERKEKF